MTKWYKCPLCGYECQGFNLATNHSHYLMGFEKGDKICVNCGRSKVRQSGGT